jgi:hypothetical protein
LAAPSGSARQVNLRCNPARRLREVQGDPLAGRSGKSVLDGPHRQGRTRNPMMDGQGKSDSPIVPMKSPNNAALAAAEATEGRGGAKGKAVRGSTCQTQSWESAVPTNSRAINSFYRHVGWYWCRALRRRGQISRLTWQRMKRLTDLWLPPARLRHPLPDVRFSVTTQGRSPVR